MKCPDCRLQLLPFVCEPGPAGVRVHRCAACGGVWLTGAELTRILQRKRAGQPAAPESRSCRHTANGERCRAAGN